MNAVLTETALIEAFLAQVIQQVDTLIDGGLCTAVQVKHCFSKCSRRISALTMHAIDLLAQLQQKGDVNVTLLRYLRVRAAHLVDFAM